MNEPGNAGTTFRMGENRRLYPRRKIERLAYVDFGPDNGGMLIDISEGGLSFQGVGRMSKGQPLHLRFTLPGAGSRPVEATAELVWSNASGKGGGLQFVEITESARDQVRQWILGGDAPAGDSWRRPFWGPRPLAPMDAMDWGGGTSTAAPPPNTVPLPVELPSPSPITPTSAEDTRPASGALLDAAGTASSPWSEENVPGENVTKPDVSENSAREENVFEPGASPNHIAGHSFEEHELFGSTIRGPAASGDDTLYDDLFDEGPGGAGNDAGSAAVAETRLDAEHSAAAEPAPIPETWPDLAADPWAKGTREFAPATGDCAVTDPIPAVRAILPMRDTPVRAVPGRAEASPSETARASDFSPELAGASPSGAKTSVFFGNAGGAATAQAGKTNAMNADAGVDKPAPGFEPRSVQLNPEFDARENRNRRRSDQIENGESLITSVAVILASAGVAVFGVMIGLRIFAAPAGSGGASEDSSASLAKEMPASGGASLFQVDVVDGKNRRWVLASAGAAESTGANLARGAQPSRDAGDPRESAEDSSGTDRPDIANNIAATLPPLPIKPPHSAQASPAAAAAAEMMAPSIEGPATGDSAPRLPVIAGQEVGPARPLAPPAPVPAVAVPGAPGASFPSANRPAAASPTPGGPAPNGLPPAPNAPAASGSAPSVAPSGPIGFKGPVLISHIEPSYPALARQQHAEGDVLVRVIVGKNGIPSQMKVVRGDVRLVPAALEVIPQWRYKPALLNGQPTESQLVVTVSFRLR